MPAKVCCTPAQRRNWSGSPNLIQAPVLTTNTGKGAFPENHPLSLGASVVSAPKMLFHFLKKADCVSAWDRASPAITGRRRSPNGKMIIHCTNDPADINKEFATKAAVLGDAKLMLDALIAEIGSKKRTDGRRCRRSAA